ncbi:MAG: hypothetical protein ACREJD_06535 [Phycisphaerales bacterium]
MHSRLLFWLTFLTAMVLGTAKGHAQTPQADEIKVEAVEFGAGNVSRAGDWCGVRLRLTDSAMKQREVLVRLVLADADGDRPAYSRSITLNPGSPIDAWIYFRLPFWFRTGETVLAMVNEPIADDREPIGMRPGRLLARRQILPGGKVQDAGTPMIGVIGIHEMGLRQYATVAAAGSMTYPALAHEAIEAVPGLTAKGMPDRWMGLAPFETIVWGESTGGTDTDISQLRGDKTASIKEWVKRGGHLVIVLPPSGQSWTNAATNELMDILPAVNIMRREGVDLTDFRGLITRSKETALPRSAVLHVFEPLNSAQPGDAIRILSGPKGECIVARRLVGIGAVTLVGLDLSSRLFSQGGVLDADIFWHRVLGKRGILQPDQKEVVARGAPITVDQKISSQIAKRGTAVTGVLLGITVFVLYWLLAGPLGFGVLKARKATRFAWLTFLVTAIGFTGLAFGAATWFRPRHFEATHLTLLDHIYGQHNQRARSWMSLMLPHDGTVRVVAPDSEGLPQASGMRHELGGVLSPWDPVGNSQRSGFLDSREYQVDGRDPTMLDLPSRSTVKQIQLDWAGAPRWGMPHPIQGSEIRAQGAKLIGALTHELPAPIHDLIICHVIGQQPLGADVRSRLVSRVQFWKWPANKEWAPGVPLDLTVETEQALALNSGELYLSNMVPTSNYTFAINANADSRAFQSVIDAMTAASLFPELGIPDEASKQQSINVAVLRREATQCLDLARWFTQPCVIVIGFVGGGPGGVSGTGPGSAAPVTVSIGGKPMETNGMTVVRWVYPLADLPPSWRGLSELPEPK